MPTATVLVLVAVAFAGCGDDEPGLTNTERMVRAAQELTVAAAELERGLAGAATELPATSGEARERLVERVEEQRERAEALAERARDDLPPDLPPQDELERAGERLAAAAEELADFAEAGGAAQLAAAGGALADARRLQASAAEQLADRPPPELRALIERLRDPMLAAPAP